MECLCLVRVAISINEKMPVMRCMVGCRSGILLLTMSFLLTRHWLPWLPRSGLIKTFVYNNKNSEMKRTPPALVPQAYQPESSKAQRQRIFLNHGDRKKKHGGLSAWMSPKISAETGFTVESRNYPTPYEQTSPFYLTFVTKATLWDRGVYHYTHRNHHEIPTAPCPRFIAHMATSPEALQYTRTLSNMSAHLRGNKAYEKPFHKTTSKWVMSGSARNEYKSSKFHQGGYDRKTVNIIRSQVQATKRQDLLVAYGGGKASKPIEMALPGHAVHNIPRQPVPSLVSSHVDLEENAVTKQADIAQDEKNADTANDTQTDKEELKNTQMFSLASHSKDYERCKQTISYCSCVLNEPSGLPVDGTSTISGGSEESGLSGRMSSCSTIYRSSSTSISQLRSASLSLSVGDASVSEEASGTYPVTGHKKPILAASGYCKSIQNPCLNSCSFHGNTELHQTSSYSKIKCSEVSRLESSFVESWHDHHLHHWPVLPPISSQRDFSGSRSGDDPSGRRSHMSAVSSGLQDTFDELEMIVPQTGSSLSNSYVGSLSSSEICKTAASLDLGCYDSNEESLTDIRLSLLNHSNWGQEDHNYEANDDEWEGKTHTFTDIHTQGPLLLLAPAIESVTETSDTYPNKRVDVHQNIYTMLTGAEEIKLGVRKQSIHQSEEDIREMLLLKSHFLDSSCSMKGQLYGKDASKKEEGYDLESNRTEEEQLPPIMRRRPVKMDYSIKEEMEKQRIAEERRMQAASIYSKLQKARSTAIRGTQPISISKFEDFDFLAKYCIFSQEKLAEYKRAFEAVDSDGDGYLDCLEVLMALKEIVPPGALSDAEELYVYRILEIVDYYVTDGLTDLRLFAVMASLAQKIAALDSFMRSLIDRMDFKTLELKMYKAKQLFLCNIDLENKISVAQLLVELKAGGISQQHEEAIQMELQHIKRLDILDFLTYLPLFVLIHKSVISNPLDDSRTI